MIPNVVYNRILDVLEILAGLEQYEGSVCELETFNIDTGYYSCKKEYDLDVSQFDLDRLDELEELL